jgi:hypothetical protein
VHLDGVSKSLDVAAWAQSGAPANLDFDEVHGPSVGASRRRLVATVTDLHGNPVPNAKLRLTAKGGRVSPSRAVSDERGAVPRTWTPGSGAVLSGAIAGTDVRETYALHVGPDVHQAGAPMKPATAARMKAKPGARAPR